MNRRSYDCERTRGWISAGLDGELTEFEAVLAEGHVRNCAACAAFKRDATAATAAFRSAPQELPTRPVAVPRRRRALQPVRIPAVAAGVLAVAFGGIFASLHSADLIGGRTPSAEAASDNNRDVQIRRKQAAFSALRARQIEARSAAVQIPRKRGLVNP